uniref:protein EFR3 homolog B-like isoform X2 n=1 Tax=Myxine glutinosa TaxID=7769 RepID=UPI00358DE06D
MQPLMCLSYSSDPVELYVGWSECDIVFEDICSCFRAFRPRYKVLVDSIFPEDPREGLVKSNMEKLTFYAVSAPEKLDRIGRYLSERLSRNVARRRYGYVFIAMEALDQLLMACHSQRINLFVESFTNMVTKLLESNEPELQILGTNSFVKFANIEEDTPCYHRRYDFFVSKFSSMCHSNCDSEEVNMKIRLAGIRGLQGVVRKTVNDELQATIWNPQHMNKIVPSLLFNMQHTEEEPSNLRASTLAENESKRPSSLAEVCFRELLSRAGYGTLKSIIMPTLNHMDNHSHWDPNAFALRSFKIIMYSIQPQLLHLVLQQLLTHLDKHAESRPPIRAGLIRVLSETVSIPASIGPAVLEVFNTLLKHLRFSVDRTVQERRSESTDPTCKSWQFNEKGDESKFQDVVIDTIGSFASILPDYQCSEVMMFILGKMPLSIEEKGSQYEESKIFQVMLLRSLLKVSQEFRNTNLSTTLSNSILGPLLSSTLLEEPEIHLLSLVVLQSLLDRHHNLERLGHVRIIPDVSSLKLRTEKCTKQDAAVMRKHGQQIYRQLYQSCNQEDKDRRHFNALYKTLVLLALELSSEESVLVDLLRLALAMQEAAQGGERLLSVYNQCAMHAVVASFLNVLSQCMSVIPFQQHVSKVIETRTSDAPFLLPEEVFRDEPRLPRKLPRECKALLFLPSVIAEALQSCAYNGERIGIPYEPMTDEHEGHSHRRSLDTTSIQLEDEVREDNGYKPEEVTFESLKNVIADSAASEEQEKEKQRRILEKFQKAPFEEIAAQCEARAISLQNKFDKIFELTVRPPPSPLEFGHLSPASVPVYEMKLPDLCVY